MKNVLLIGALLFCSLFPWTARSHTLLEPSISKLEGYTLSVEQPHWQNELIIRLSSLKINSAKTTCTIYLIVEKNGKDIRYKLHELSLTKFEKTKYTNTFVGIYRNEVDMIHGAKVLVSFQQKGMTSSLESSLIMAFH